jgi:hypothetical protein
MAESDGVDGRHKAGHDSGGRSINSNRYKSPIVVPNRRLSAASIQKQFTLGDLARTQLLSD